MKKQTAIQTALELCYPYDVINRIREAKTESQITRIMQNERKRQSDIEHRKLRKERNVMRSWIWRDCA